MLQPDKALVKSIVFIILCDTMSIVNAHKVSEEQSKLVGIAVFFPFLLSSETRRWNWRNVWAVLGDYLVECKCNLNWLCMHGDMVKIEVNFFCHLPRRLSWAMAIPWNSEILVAVALDCAVSDHVRIYPWFKHYAVGAVFSWPK
jgi:hypothetical protein